MKREYEMSEEDLAGILKACRPVPYIAPGGVPPRSPQENANDAWRELGGRMGFDHMTVQPVPGKGERFFAATPMEERDESR